MTQEKKNELIESIINKFPEKEWIRYRNGYSITYKGNVVLIEEFMATNNIIMSIKSIKLNVTLGKGKENSVSKLYYKIKKHYGELKKNDEEQEFEKIYNIFVNEI